MYPGRFASGFAPGRNASFLENSLKGRDAMTIVRSAEVQAWA